MIQNLLIVKKGIPGFKYLKLSHEVTEEDEYEKDVVVTITIIE